MRDLQQTSIRIYEAVDFVDHAELEACRNFAQIVQQPFEAEDRAVRLDATVQVARRLAESWPQRAINLS
eukprot:6829852-Pyramimonas_sp.AAC.1